MRRFLLFLLLFLFPYFIYSQFCIRDTSLHEFQYLAPDNFGWEFIVEDTNFGYMRGQSLYKKAYNVDCQQDGKMIIVSSRTMNETYITRSEENGRVDTSFANGGGFTLNTLFPTFARFYGFKIYLDNIYLIFSNTDALAGVVTNYIIGLDANGNPLGSFGNNGVVQLDTNIHNVAYTAINIDTNGDIFLSGGNTVSGQIEVTKITTTTGTEVSSFGNNGIGVISTSGLPEIKSILFDNGSILVSGSQYNSADIVAKFLANGTADLSFNGTGHKAFTHATYKYGDQSNLHKTQNGNYILTGSFWDDDTWRRMVYALEFNSQGVINTSYGNNGWSIIDIGINTTIGAVKSHLLDDDRLIVSSMKALHKTVSTIDSSKIVILMLKADGTLDNTFAPGGLFYDQLLFRNYSAYMSEHGLSGMTIDKKGRIVIVGRGNDCTHGFCGDDGFLARYIFQKETASVYADEYVDKVSVSMYPNPTTGKVTLDLGREFTNFTVILTNSFGQQLSSQHYELANRFNFEIVAPAGIYFLTIRSKNSFMKTIKLIKN